MDRRGFLRGTLLSAPAVLLGPGVVDLVGSETAPVAILSPSEEASIPNQVTLIERLTKRIYAYEALAQEPPKALFVNRYEFRALTIELAPHTRFMNDLVAKKGYNNLMLRGVPVITVDDDSIYFDPRGPA